MLMWNFAVLLNHVKICHTIYIVQRDKFENHQWFFILYLIIQQRCFGRFYSHKCLNHKQSHEFKQYQNIFYFKALHTIFLKHTHFILITHYFKNRQYTLSISSLSFICSLMYSQWSKTLQTKGIKCNYL